MNSGVMARAPVDVAKHNEAGCARLAKWRQPGHNRATRSGEAMRFAWFAALLLLPSLAYAAGIDPALLDAARKEGQVVWYTGLIVNQIARPMAEAFEAQVSRHQACSIRAPATPRPR